MVLFCIVGDKEPENEESPIIATDYRALTCDSSGGGIRTYDTRIMIPLL